MAGAGTRAKRGYIKGLRYDKAGRVRPARLHPIPGLAGAISGKEMEKMMLQVADEQGLSASDIVIETYEKGEAPRESNPAVDDKFERYTRSVATDGYLSNYDRAFSGKGRAPVWDTSRPGVARRVTSGESDSK